MGKRRAPVPVAAAGTRSAAVALTHRPLCTPRSRPFPLAQVFLISLTAGGLGLNLQDAASLVFLMEPWYNFAVEAQAVGRVHRLGQTRTVHVTRYIAAGTVEQDILAIQDRKAALAAGALGGGDAGAGGGARLTEDDLRSFFDAKRSTGGVGGGGGGGT
jgi:hypothetical protein